MPITTCRARRAFLYGGSVGGAYRNTYTGSAGFSSTLMLPKIAGLSSMSVSMWFRLNPAIAYPSVAITCHTHSMGFLIWINTAASGPNIASQWKTAASGTTWVAVAASAIPNIAAFKNPNRIHHAVLTLGGGISNTYLNGTLMTSVSGAGTLGSSSGYPVGVFYDGYSSGYSAGGLL